MEDLGEDYVGYTHTLRRSRQFGTSHLRLARALEPGFVITVEPGIYFIPELIDQWKTQGKFEDFTDYNKVENYRDFGGIRIEDNVLVHDAGKLALGKPIAKTIEEVEAISSQILSKEEEMKTIVVLSSFAILITFTGLLPIGGNVPAGATDAGGGNIQSSNAKTTWEIPIAAGVWYPTDGPVPDKPMRYYRVRCWPGCHTGSNYGKYPTKILNDTPIFPTSAASAHSVIPPVQE